MKDEEGKKIAVLIAMSQHIGRERAVGMGELYEQVFGKLWRNRINDTRDLRRIITDLRKSGTPICSHPGRNGGGYYLAGAGSELEQYLKKRREQALKILWTESQIRKVSMAELLGQMQLAITDDQTTDEQTTDGQTV